RNSNLHTSNGYILSDEVRADYRARNNAGLWLEWQYDRVSYGNRDVWRADHPHGRRSPFEGSRRHARGADRTAVWGRQHGAVSLPLFGRGHYCVLYHGAE